MTSEFLLDAIGQMDDELVLEAAAPIRRAVPWRKVAGWAAAIVLCVGITHIPGLLSRNGAGSAAAPESNLSPGYVVGDVMLDADAKGDDYEYRTEQELQVQKPSAASKADSTTADGAAQGVMEPKFFTQRGLYLLSGDEPYKPKMPFLTNANALGALVAAVPGEQVYPSTGTQELVGCFVWESVDGKTLYIELPDGGCLIAKRYQ